MRISFWTTCPLEPGYEAVSKEVFDLADHFAGRIFSVSPHLKVRVGRRGRCLGFHPWLDPLLRPLIRLLERAGDVNHVYSEPMPWIFHRSLKSKPLVLTVTSEHGEPRREFLQRCRVIAVQTEGMKRQLESLGFTREQVRLIYPGVDLSSFEPRTSVPEHARRPRILLATFPRTAEEMGPRGVRFLVDMARRYPQYDFHFISRPWSSGSTALGATQALVQEAGVTNVEISQGVQENMADLYRSHDFTVIAYTTVDGGKECPRSLIESLACGVPVLISDVAPFSSFVQEHVCGQVFALDADSFGAAVERGLRDFRVLSQRAASAARDNFDVRATFAAYARIYEQVA